MKYYKYTLTFLSVLLSGLLLYIFDNIWGSKIHWANYRNINFNNFLFVETTVTVKALYIIILLVLLYPGYRLFSKLFKMGNAESINNINKKRAKTKEFNSYSSSEKKLLFRWNVYFDYLSNPKIEHLIPYCTRHGDPPLKLIIGSKSNGVSKYVCTVPNCKTHISADELKKIENYLESVLVSLYNKS